MPTRGTLKSPSFGAAANATAGGMEYTFSSAIGAKVIVCGWLIVTDNGTNKTIIAGPLGEFQIWTTSSSNKLNFRFDGAGAGNYTHTFAAGGEDVFFAAMFGGSTNDVELWVNNTKVYTRATLVSQKMLAASGTFWVVQDDGADGNSRDGVFDLCVIAGASGMTEYAPTTGLNYSTVAGGAWTDLSTAAKADLWARWDGQTAGDATQDSSGGARHLTQSAGGGSATVDQTTDLPPGANPAGGTTMVADTASLTIGAPDTGLTTQRGMVADTAAMSISAPDAALTVQARMTAETASIAAAAPDAGFIHDYVMPAGPASLAIGVPDTGLTVFRVMVADPASLAIGAPDTALTVQAKMTADPVAIVITGIDVTLSTSGGGATMIADPASLAIGAPDVMFPLARVMTAAVANLAIGAPDAGLSVDRPMVADPASIAITAPDVGLAWAHRLVADPAAIVITGIDATMIAPGGTPGRIATPAQSRNAVRLLAPPRNAVRAIALSRNSVRRL